MLCTRPASCTATGTPYGPETWQRPPVRVRNASGQMVFGTPSVVPEPGAGTSGKSNFTAATSAHAATLVNTTEVYSEGATTVCNRRLACVLLYADACVAYVASDAAAPAAAAASSSSAVLIAHVA
eukprot:50912-Prymnesium_polylepis.1